MATPTTPSTPVVQKQTLATPTGAWRHPQFNEITKRQYATNFDEQNVRQIVWNVGFLTGSFLVVPFINKVALLRAIAGPLYTLASTYSSYAQLMLILIRLIFILNTVVAFLPLIRRRWLTDDVADIPLTPSQRVSMGLDPTVQTPQTPGSAYASPNYITPPRYPRSTPRNSFSGQSSRRGTPLSGSPRELGISTSNSPFSPNSGSPLFQKVVGGHSGSTPSKRLSLGGQSPLGNSFFGESSSGSVTPGTPTPGVGKASVGLNNKWLYEKGRGSPRGSAFFA